MPLTLHTNNGDHAKKTGNLFVVATPIGNMDDITLRALKVLESVDLIAAEDTRHSRKLLAHHNIKGRFISFHEHNEAKRTPEIIKKIKDGIRIALLSDAGTPTLSDPGYRLIKAAVKNQIKIVPIPGVSAAITALSVSGLPTDAFIFAGFPAKKKAKRLEQLKVLKDEPKTIIFYESPRRIIRFVEEIINIMGDRHGVLSREMTKLHEEFIRGKLSEIMSILNDRPAVKGECTLLISGLDKKDDVDYETIKSDLLQALRKTENGLKKISTSIAEQYGVSKRKVYNKALKIKKDLKG